MKLHYNVFLTDFQYSEIIDLDFRSMLHKSSFELSHTNRHELGISNSATKQKKNL